MINTAAPNSRFLVSTQPLNKFIGKCFRGIGFSEEEENVRIILLERKVKNRREHRKLRSPRTPGNLSFSLIMAVGSSSSVESPATPEFCLDAPGIDSFSPKGWVAKSELFAGSQPHL